MATGGFHPTFSDFVDQTKHCLNSFYPNWKEIYNAPPNTELATLSFPDALDVLPNRIHHINHPPDAQLQRKRQADGSSEQEPEFKKNKPDFDGHMTGQEAEYEFSIKFRELKNMGGILIFGFNTEGFIKKMCDENSADFSYQDWLNDKKKLGHFECDAIFLHHQLGIFVVETKGCSEKKKIESSIDTATKQLDRRIKGLLEIYLRITKKECHLRIHGVICLPNIDNCKQQYSYPVLTRKIMEKIAKFKKFWRPRKGPVEQRSNESISDDLEKFIALLIGYRSMEFISLVTNAMEIHRIIDQQEYLKKEYGGKTLESSVWKWMLGKTIILNNKQLKAVECTEKNVIISGPPGTGKTIVLLLRALAAAKVEKEKGRVVIFTCVWKNLRALFKKIVAANQSMIRRQIEVISADYGKIDLSRTSENGDDDYFVDEMYIPSAKTSHKMDYRFISNAGYTHSGSTTIVATGSYEPANVAYVNDFIGEYFPNFHHIVLNTVFRGTISIINEWRPYFPEKYELSIEHNVRCAPVKPTIVNGHNVKGAPVERKVVSNREQLMEAIKGYVEMLLRTRASNNENNTIVFEPRNLAILVAPLRLKEELIYVTYVAQYLETFGYQCGTAVDQLEKNVIAVEYVTDVLSYDWPIVIYIGCDKEDEIELHHRTIACSRSISKLFIIYRSYSDWEKLPAS